VKSLHLITCEYPPAVGGVSEHSRVVAEAAAAEGYDVHVWTATNGAGSPRVHVRPALGDFSAAALARTDAALNECPAPRQVIVQWVPHGYGRKGLNVAFSRWIRRRARAGDRIDLIVHEPFIDYFGDSIASSWRQPAAALVQRYMTWTVVRAAERVWLTIPGWERRLRFARSQDQPAPRLLPVSGTIPPVRDAAAVATLRSSLLKGQSRLIGYFGAGGRYPFDALRAAVAGLAAHDVAFVCIGRGSDALASQLQAADPAPTVPVTGTGALALDRVSLHLQACDALMQPYPDGVSGRRTTTISALEHAVPVATTVGWLSEPFWSEAPAVETVPATAAATLPAALLRLLEPARNAAARAGAVALYRERFDPARTLKALFTAIELPTSAEAAAARRPASTEVSGLPEPGTSERFPRTRAGRAPTQ
jgi:glycosyltransferase involved in cell wall biosynthesis